MLTLHNSDLLLSIVKQPPSHVVVALSGGSDSTALVLLIKDWATPLGIKVSALTVDHMLRPESTAEAHAVAALMVQHNIDHVILTWEHAALTGNIQEQARKARYTLMTDWCHHRGVKYLFTAHQADDQAETVVQRLLRGSGVDGVAGIPTVSHWNGITIIRPLLSYSRDELRTYLIDRHVTWIDDPSNMNEAFDRIKIRNMMPILATVTSPHLLRKRLHDYAAHMSRVKDFLHQQTNEAESHCCLYHPFGFAQFDFLAFGLLHDEIQYRLLSKMLQKVSGTSDSVRFQSLDALLTRIKQGKSFRTTLHGCIIQLIDLTCYIIREPGAVDTCGVLQANIFDNRFKLTFSASLLGAEIIPLSNLSKQEKSRIAEACQAINALPGFGLKHLILEAFPAIRTLEKEIIVPHISHGSSNQRVDCQFLPLLEELQGF